MLTPVDRKIGELQQLDPPALRILWSKAFGRPSPKKMSRDLLLRAVAYQDQEKAEGGFSKAALKRLINPANANGNIVRPPAPRLKPGTRLVREWHGEVHQVTVLECRKRARERRRYSGPGWRCP